MPIKDEKRDTAIVKISDYEFMLTEVDIKGKKRKDRYERPPLSEVRFNFLDEWEYAKEKIIERSLLGKRDKEDIGLAFENGHKDKMFILEHIDEIEEYYQACMDQKSGAQQMGMTEAEIVQDAILHTKVEKYYKMFFPRANFITHL